MIKILTGYSDKGGSTVALTNLTNSLNEAGYETVMYGPHDYHLDKCKSGKLTEDVVKNVSTEDRVITHFLKLPQRPNAKKVVLTCIGMRLFSSIRHIGITITNIRENTLLFLTLKNL